MVTSALVRLILAWRESRRKCETVLNNIVLENSLCAIQRPFRIHPNVEFRNSERIAIARNCTIKKGVIVDGRSASKELGVSLGPDTYIKEYCYFDAYWGQISTEGCVAIGQFCMMAGQGGLKIGKYVMIGGHCYILTSNHITDNLDLPYMMQGDRRASVVIEDNVWIGGGSIVLGGVTIGKNSVVGAGSIVTKDIPPNSMYVDRNPSLIKGAMLHLARNAP